MKRKYVILGVFCCLLMLHCGGGGGSSSGNPFAGSWELIFAGDAIGSLVTTISSKGNFSASLIMTDGYFVWTVTISGHVSKNGDISGDIYNAGFDIGDFNGHATGDAASGTWADTTYGLFGTFSGTRQ